MAANFVFFAAVASSMLIAFAYGEFFIIFSFFYNICHSY